MNFLRNPGMYSKQTQEQIDYFEHIPIMLLLLNKLFEIWLKISYSYKIFIL